MGKTLVGSVATIVAWIAWGISRGSGWIYERAERIRSDLEAISTDY